ncbi:L-serine ammonia-lyase, iron-sulfur-dependent, subunit alpha [Oceanospirillum sanctuarii]|uniref:L-serine ammonia-lyase, iron-sulfur-dependent, subunit alpha n=1 Tax=Oceanospirillum sanctuarii TaxID=1434821 RepID=UPI000A3D37C9|nr:L-serine ammonia-lyase, iron-sulfur-dependent, subunit alpha [Oceanospirillum sanctuarii]
MNAPSIFNDVLGPVMRGPSSSHCAGALRIGRLARDLMLGDIKHALIEYDPNGSLVTTHKSQGSDMGLFGGFLGWDADEEELVNYESHLRKAGISTEIQYRSIGATHPNTYKLTLSNDNIRHEFTALSTGGGMIEVISIDQAPVQLMGDSYVLVVYPQFTDREALEVIVSGLNLQLKTSHKYLQAELSLGTRPVVLIESVQAFSDSLIQQVCSQFHTQDYRVLNPVMPVLNNPEMALPFKDAEEMLSYVSANPDKPLHLIALEYESARSGLSHDQLMLKMKALLNVMKNAVSTGLNGTQFTDRILHAQSPTFQKKHQANELLPSSLLNEVVMQVSAIMEAKSAMHTIVAAPTAGSCGAMAGAVLATGDVLGSSEDKVCEALFVAGLIGVLISKDATFAAEEAGCMAECGSGSGMAAAALVTLHEGNTTQSLTAASMALQNSFGMTCDPVANRVEAPCLGKNVMAASNALSCANMALAGFDQVVPLDEVIIAMAKVGKAIPHELCCTALGGLSQTPTAQRIEAQLSGAEAPVEVLRFKSC